MQNHAIEWLMSYFAEKKHATLPENAIEENYFELGLTNSLEIIELIEKIEEHFNIKFNAVHFQEHRFSTIKGLAEIIKELQSA